MSKIVLSLIMIIAVAVIAIGATGAYFSDTETSNSNTFAASVLDLNVNNTDTNVVMFAVSDVVPGATGNQQIVLNNVGNLNGFLDISFANLVNDDVSCNEPESDVDTNCGDGEVGELANNLDILTYIDQDENDIYASGTDELIYNGKALNIVGEKLSDYSLTASSSKDFLIEWSVNSDVGNIIQSDKVGFDVQFELAQTAGQ